ncbi:MAG: hypothetical protein H6746_08060 [Deltaproteobacteria bacterium]|nr:hypothetical protein [Deltaproteobacteria bacterium]
MRHIQDVVSSDGAGAHHDGVDSGDRESLRDMELTLRTFIFGQDAGHRARGPGQYRPRGRVARGREAHCSFLFADPLAS